MLINTRNHFITNNFLLYHVFESSIATTEKKLQIDLTWNSLIKYIIYTLDKIYLADFQD